MKSKQTNNAKTALLTTPHRAADESGRRMIISNKYEGTEELGRGGMGVVYKVRHLRLNSVFALKMLHSALAVDRELVTRFHREAKIMAGLHHPNIVRIFDIDQDGDHHYFVMEYVPGRNLSEVLSEKGSLTLDEVVNIGLQVGQGEFVLYSFP